jgi:3-oxoacyl-[acyl-carrier-protein] synthase I
MTATSPPGLHLVAGGLCCSLGYQLAAASCALRAELDHFSESEFEDSRGAPIRVGRLPDQDLWGVDRYARWAELALRDAIGQRPMLDPKRCALVLLLPHAYPNTALPDSFARATALALERCGWPSDVPAEEIRAGRAGLAQALNWAAKHLLTNAPPAIDHVLLIALDSHLHAPAINHLLAQQRLRSSSSFDGMIPGEAAACLLLQRSNAAQGAGTALALKGWGLAQEDGRPDGSTPSLATGLTQALRTALEQAQGKAPTQEPPGYRVSDQNGEVFFAREAANALSRVFFGQPGPQTLLTLADKLGDIGAATGPAMLAHLWQLATQDLLPAPTGLLHMADAEGDRAAVVVQAVKATSST